MTDSGEEPARPAGAEIVAVARGGATPLWRQVQAALTERIRARQLAEHDRLPSEAELCRSFGVSRTVVREALAQMVNDGLIYRLQGKGAFVRGQREEHGFAGTNVGFSGDLQEGARRVTSRILRQEVTTPSARICRHLRLGPQERVVAVDRVLSVDGVPRAVVRCAMLAVAVPGLERAPLENRSLYDTIARQYGIVLVQAERWIEALSLGAEDAALLEVAPGTAALCIESVGSSAQHGTIEYYTAHYLTDRSRLRFVVRTTG